MLMCWHKTVYIHVQYHGVSQRYQCIVFANSLFNLGLNILELTLMLRVFVRYVYDSSTDNMTVVDGCVKQK